MRSILLFLRGFAQKLRFLNNLSQFQNSVSAGTLFPMELASEKAV
jgi:hypothetical protein